MLLSLNRFSKDDFSYSKTSKPAPSICPDFKAETRSEVTTLLPRAVFMSQNGFLNPFIRSLLTIFIVDSVSGVCRLSTSAFS